MSLIVSLEVRKEQQLVESLAKARALLPVESRNSPAPSAAAKRHHADPVPQQPQSGGPVEFLVLGSVQERASTICTSSVDRLLHRIRVVLANQRNIKLQWTLVTLQPAEGQSPTDSLHSARALQLTPESLSSVQELQELLRSTIGMEVPNHGKGCTASIPLGDVAAGAKMAAAVEVFTNAPVKSRKVQLWLSSSATGAVTSLGSVDFFDPPADAVYRDRGTQQATSTSVVPKREVLQLDCAFEKDMEVPAEATAAAIARASAWVHARRAMASLPRSREAWENVLADFGRVRIRCATDPLIQRMVTSKFLEATTVKVEDTTKPKIFMVCNGTATKFAYKRVDASFDAKSLKPPQTLRTFPAITESPAYSIKKRSNSSNAAASPADPASPTTTVDPPVPPPQLGDAAAFSAKMSRGLKQMISNLKPARDSNRVVIPEGRFKQAVSDMSVVRATVPAKDIVDALVANGTLVASRLPSTGDEILVPSDIVSPQ
jgi:hypothetical protein